MFYNAKRGIVFFILWLSVHQAFCHTLEREIFSGKLQPLSQQLHTEVGKPGLYVFVSLSMPEQSLKNWAWQVQRVGGTVVLRGFYQNSLKATTQQAIALFGEKTAVDIDPERFARFNIKQVPSVVVVNDQHQFDTITGDLTLEAALEKMLTRGSKEVHDTTQLFLAKARG